MSDLRFRLFGKFRGHLDGQPVKGLDARKDQELVSFLLIRADQHHSREALAALLWGDNPTAASKKYLRQSVWHLQTLFDSAQRENSSHLLVEHDWLRINPASPPWCDVDEFQKAFSSVEGVPGKELGPETMIQLQEAVALYRDDLLAGWYQDWVLFERERLQNKFLLLLDKLIAYSELHREYEHGQSYAAKILRYDPARERTHRELMRLFYLSGDRTSALRQYDCCVTALKRELGVKPERRTVELYEQIRSDHFNPLEVADLDQKTTDPPESVDLVGRLKQLHGMLATVQQRIRRDIKAIETLPRTERRKFSSSSRSSPPQPAPKNSFRTLPGTLVRRSVGGALLYATHTRQKSGRGVESGSPLRHGLC